MSSALLLSGVASVPLTFFDVETTGLYPDRGDRICEIAMVRTYNGIVERTWDTLLDPERTVPPDASRVSGITSDMVWGKPMFADVIEEIERFAADSVLVAHNASFDLSFLYVQCQEAGREMPRNAVLDTLILARRCYKLSDYSLGGLAKALRIQKETFHRALGDSMMTSRIFQAMLPIFKQKKLATVGHVLQFQGGTSRPALRPTPRLVAVAAAG